MPAVHVSKLVPAPPEWVFDAWLTPHTIAAWMTPGEVDATVDVDPTVGGRYIVRHHADGAYVGGFEAELLTLDRPQLLRWRWGFVLADRDRGGPRHDSILTVRLTPEGDGTHVDLVHDRLDDLRSAAPWIAGNVGLGWDHVLDLLVRTAAERR